MIKKYCSLKLEWWDSLQLQGEKYQENPSDKRRRRR
jgi:hypothetical protein